MKVSMCAATIGLEIDSSSCQVGIRCFSHSSLCVCLSVCVWLSIFCLCICLLPSGCASVSVGLCDCLSVFESICQSVWLSTVCLSVECITFVCLCVCLSAYCLSDVSVYVSVWCICLCVCLSVCLLVRQSSIFYSINFSKSPFVDRTVLSLVYDLYFYLYACLSINLQDSVSICPCALFWNQLNL